MNTRRRAEIGTVLAVLGLAAATPLAHAGGGNAAGGICAGHVFSQPLGAFGDFANYLPATGGDFESGLAGFSVAGGAYIRGGNQPYGIAGAANGHSLAMPAGSTVTTPPLCVTADYPSMRLFARSETGSGKLKVEVVYADSATGRTTISGVGDVDSKIARGSWRLSGVFPTLAGKRGVSMSVRLTAEEKGTWSVDDVLVDPHSRG